MLQNLHVKNLALIDECEVEFSDGLNILSGETGAGKSIIIGSINLALGEKVPKEMLRDNDESSFVELVFSVDNESVLDELKKLDIELDDNTVILSRKITSGRAVGKINGEAVSVSKMKEVASLLIDIHGQHEHQSLLSKKNHLKILDAYAKKELGNRLQMLSELYHTYRLLQNEWENSNIGSSERMREIDLLKHEVNEIEEANLVIGEDKELEIRFRKFTNAKKIAEAIYSVEEALNSEMDSASERIGRGVRELGSIASYDQEVESLEGQLAEIENLLQDFNHDLSSYISSLEFDEASYYETEQRLNIINHLKTKYGNDLEQVFDALAKKQERIQTLEDYDSYLAKLEVNLKSCEGELAHLCDEVSSVRKKASIKMCEEIKAALTDLNFLDVQFEMQFERTNSYGADGFDDVLFVISTNPGEPLKALDKVASGGELSRIMLAIKTVMASEDKIESLIFDEIDSGISGRTAQMVSEKMNVLGRNHQIICITHLPQIAAMADSHYLIEKEVVNQTTKSHIRLLSQEESVNELARMLGGVEITDTVLQNAKEMKDLAYMKK